ncbi:hypothetical protein DPMN_160661 [Dreissena polymorpha]|uniref:HPr domain-containing protein n=1 Tax=Dreissena polymorpha TaxID=45954 RepID=A0A9D4ELY4_DREPO|nr:hypothetical protein DPMN_160661 [Dreissena polymorpha]
MFTDITTNMQSKYIRIASYENGFYSRPADDIAQFVSGFNSGLRDFLAAYTPKDHVRRNRLSYLCIMSETSKQKLDSSRKPHRQSEETLYVRYGVQPKSPM